MKTVFTRALAAALSLFLALGALAAPVTLSSEPYTVTDDLGGVTVTHHELELTDETNAVWTVATAQEGYYDCVNRTMGTYTEENGEIVFTENTLPGVEVPGVTFFSVSENAITAEPITVWVMPGTALAVGTAQGTGSSVGATLEIKSYNRAVLTDVDGTVYTGTMNPYGDDWDLYAQTGLHGWSDQCIRFDADGGFTVIPFGTVSEYAYLPGVYTMTGDLGEITCSLQEDGTATAFLSWQGIKCFLSGFAYSADDAGRPTGLYLSDDFGISADLTVTELPDGVLNYQGSFTFPLAAG